MKVFLRSHIVVWLSVIAVVAGCTSFVIAATFEDSSTAPYAEKQFQAGLIY